MLVTFTVMVQVSSSSATVPTLYKQDGNLKAMGDKYIPVKRIVIYVNTIESLGETTKKTAAVGTLLPEQE